MPNENEVNGQVVPTEQTSPNSIKDNIIDGLVAELIPLEGEVEKDEIVDTINGILKDYNLSTNDSFIERIAKMKISQKGGKIETVDLQELPKELKDASFLPVNTIADIALRQDIDLVVSQIPEYYTSIGMVRDAICEADVVTGRLSRDIKFDKANLSESEKENVISKIEEVEEKLELNQIIKNHMVFNTLQYGEGYVYVIPYSKVFADLHKYRTSASDKATGNVVSMFNDTSSSLDGYGYHEHAVEKRLSDTIVMEAAPVPAQSKKKKGDYKRNTGMYQESVQLFTEAEIQEINPSYHSVKDKGDEKYDEQAKVDTAIDESITEIAKNISYIEDDIAIPVIEQSSHDLIAVYREKYRERNESYIQESKTFFESVMDEKNEEDKDAAVPPEFSKIKGVYMKILPATKLIPIRIDRVVIGYYYVSDLTRPEEAGDRKNSGLHGYTLRTPSIGFDTFSPDQMFADKLANKIINNFDLKFMRDNVSIHKQIVAVLQAHKFNEARMRFIFIPAEHVVQCTINKDGAGKGHSMLEAGLVTSRMYMFLKLYCLLYQINNSGIRAYYLRTSGIDKNYKALIQDTIRKFAARRVTANDIFNYRNAMPKVSGGSEMVMPLGPGDKRPIDIENIAPAEAPLSMDLLNQSKDEAINANPVPSAMVQGAMSELEFAKEVETSQERFHTYCASLKIDLNPDITRLYRIIMRWETDIDPKILNTLTFAFRQSTAKKLAVTTEMLNNFNGVWELASSTLLTKAEMKDMEADTEESGGVAREFKKAMISEYLGSAIDVDRLEELLKDARKKANKTKLEETNPAENMVDDQEKLEEEMM
jgi:hypothetical protein